MNTNEESVDVAALKMPVLNQQLDRQWTGKGWLEVDPEAAEEQLRDIQRELAVRQAEMVAGERTD